MPSLFRIHDLTVLVNNDFKSPRWQKQTWKNQAVTSRDPVDGRRETGPGSPIMALQLQGPNCCSFLRPGWGNWARPKRECWIEPRDGKRSALHSPQKKEEALCIAYAGKKKAYTPCTVNSRRPEEIASDEQVQREKGAMGTKMRLLCLAAAVAAAAILLTGNGRSPSPPLSTNLLCS